MWGNVGIDRLVDDFFSIAHFVLWRNVFLKVQGAGGRDLVTVYLPSVVPDIVCSSGSYGFRHLATGMAVFLLGQLARTASIGMRCYYATPASHTFF
jgi:hypothetical protein